MKIESVRPSDEDIKQIKKMSVSQLKTPEEKLIERGEISIKKRIQKEESKEEASDIYLVEVKDGNKIAEGVFKPCGEGHGMNCRCSREEATYLASKILGFDIVPTTGRRDISNDNFGVEDVGSIQLYDYGEIADNAHLDDSEDGIIRLRIFDYVVWNYDRHDWNYLVTSEGKTTAVDNESSFGAKDDDAARKEIIGDIEDIADKQIPDDVIEIFEKYQNDPRVQIKLKKSLKEFLDVEMVNAMLSRIDKVSKFILSNGTIPSDERSIDTLTYR